MTIPPGSPPHEERAAQSGALETPQRSFWADFLAIAVLGFVVFGFGFSWLGAQSSPVGESFSDIFLTTGIWSGLMFGVTLGVVFGLLLQPRTAEITIESATAFRARFETALPKARLKIVQQTATEVLVTPMKRPVIPILKEVTALLRISPQKVEMIGNRFITSNLKRKLRV